MYELITLPSSVEAETLFSRADLFRPLAILTPSSLNSFNACRKDLREFCSTLCHASPPIHEHEVLTTFLLAPLSRFSCSNCKSPLDASTLTRVDARFNGTSIRPELGPTSPFSQFSFRALQSFHVDFPSDSLSSVRLMTGSNQAMTPLVTVASGLDGTTGEPAFPKKRPEEIGGLRVLRFRTGTGKYEWTCPEVNPNSAVSSQIQSQKSVSSPVCETDPIVSRFQIYFYRKSSILYNRVLVPRLTPDCSRSQNSPKLEVQLRGLPDSRLLPHLVNPCVLSSNAIYCARADSL
jgi:hypothetical protein